MEEWNKGFVHVDVEKMAEGEPFVQLRAYRDDGDMTTPARPRRRRMLIQEW